MSSEHGQAESRRIATHLVAVRAALDSLISDLHAGRHIGGYGTLIPSSVQGRLNPIVVQLQQVPIIERKGVSPG